MWIIPKNYQPSSAFVPDTVELKEDLILLESSIKSSLMWRSKPTLLRIWLIKWNQVSWLPPLFGRILKPSQHTYFETELQSSLVDIHANHFQQQGNDKAQMIPDTYGPTSDNIFKPSDQNELFLRMSKGIYRLDSPQSSATWKKMVMQQRGEYSQRVKLAHHTKESESLSWATPNTMDHLPQRSEEALRRQAQTTRKGRSRPANLREQVNPRAVEIYQEVKGWPTPRASEYKDCGPVGSKSQVHMDNKSYLCAKVKDPSMPSGCLNPEWVEWLMGVPIGWTELDF